MEVIATGVRNSVGFDWHPQTKEMTICAMTEHRENLRQVIVTSLYKGAIRVNPEITGQVRVAEAQGRGV